MDGVERDGLIDWLVGRSVVCACMRACMHASMHVVWWGLYLDVAVHDGPVRVVEHDGHRGALGGDRLRVGLDACGDVVCGDPGSVSMPVGGRGEGRPVFWPSHRSICPIKRKGKDPLLTLLAARCAVL